ncbi:hypothetical protein [Paramagnetospirillum caucaseum]|nr:hypothetical protein [Paramagnetospirillum caucaseum]
MSNQLPKAPFELKEWMVPPVLVPLALIIMIALWSVLRPHVG